MWNSQTDGFYLDCDEQNNVVAITVFYQDGVFDIAKNEPRFTSVHKLINEKNFEELPKFLSNKVIFENLVKTEHFNYKNGILYIADEPVPTILGSHILEYYHSGYDFLNLINFWNNLRTSSDPVLKEDLFTYLQKEGISILPDGSFLSYRTVNGDFKDIWTKKVDNSIGTTVSLPREKVDANKSNSAGFGLHIATIKKAISFGNWSKNNKDVKLLAVKVFPQDVVVGINLQSDEAYLRACKYEVLCEITDGIPLTVTQASVL